VSITDDEDIAHIFNSYFNTVTCKLNIPSWPSRNIPIDPLSNIIHNFTSHPSIVAIKQKSPVLIFDQYIMERLLKSLLR